MSTLQKQETTALPQLPDVAAIALIVMSTVIMAFSLLVKIVPILIFLIFWLPLTFYKKTFILKPTGDALFILSLPVLCCLSTLWSDSPSTTLYHGLQYGAMLTCTLSAARLVSIDALIKGLCIGIFIVLAITLASRNYTTDYFSGESILVGYFGSKNMVGFFASLGCLIGFLSLFLKAGFFLRLSYALPTLGISALCLLISHSASSLIATTATLSALGLLFVLSKLPPAYRWSGVVLSILGGIVLVTAAFAFQINIAENILSALNRDTTLTGRTFLWQQGIEQITLRPLLGHGYTAFWVPGNQVAEYLWGTFNIPGKSGFHFHNLYIQTAIDIGLPGLALSVCILLASISAACFSFLRHGASLETAFLAGLAVMFLVRTMVEVDIMGPFGMGAFLFFMILPRALSYGRRKTRLLNSQKS